MFFQSLKKIKSFYIFSFHLFFILFCSLINITADTKEIPSDYRPNYLLYLAGSGNLNRAISYLPSFYQTKNLDFLQRLAVLILENGLKSLGKEDQRLTLYGAGVALSTHSLKILEKGLYLSDAPSQLIALHYLSILQEQQSEYLIKKALSSDFLEVRAEALFQLCLRKDPSAMGQMEALRGKLPSVFKPFFPQFLALIGTPEASARLKYYLHDENPEVRLEAILNIAKYKREELLFYLKRRFKEALNQDKEALLYVLSSFGDTVFLKEFEQLVGKHNPNLEIAAILALNRLGYKKFNHFLLQKAAKHSLLAINACSQIDNSQQLLSKLAKSENLQIKANAAFALLEKQNAACLPFLTDILTSDIFLEFHFSPGRTLKYIQAYSTPSSSTNSEMSILVKEELLKMALELEEEDFLKLAEKIIGKEKTQLAPVLFKLLENINTPASIALLQKTAKSNLPFFRVHAHLSLFRLEKPGLHEIFLIEWLEEQAAQAKIKLKQFDSGKTRFNKSQFELSRDEISQLFFEIITTFVEKHSSRASEIILKAIATGPPSNRYPLAGLLLRSIE